MKLDPYLNIDPGTMSPYQHGEVFVTKDGAETDLDLGHYERIINTSLPMGGMRIVIRTIFSNKDKSLDAIEKDVVKISEILNTTYFILSEYNL